MIGASSSLLAVAIHVIPAQFPNDMLKFALFSEMTVSHIKIGAAFVHVPIGAMFTFRTFFTHEVWTYFQVMTEIASLSVWAISFQLIFLACFNFAFIMRIGASFSLPTLAMNKFFTHSICRKFNRIVIIDGWSWNLDIIACIRIHRMITSLLGIVLWHIGIHLPHVHMRIWVLIGITHL